MQNVLSLPVRANEWWIIRTPVGRRVVRHRPRSTDGAIGPFGSELQALEKRSELEQADIRRQTVRRVLQVILAMAAGVLLATVLEGISG